MEENISGPGPSEVYNGKRPPGLTLLCVLTFIGSGLSALSSFFIAAAYNIIPAAIENSPFQNGAEMLNMVKMAGPSFFLVMGLLYLVSLTGSIFMFSLRKEGFHIYSISQLMMLIVPSLLIKGYIAPWSNILLTGSFILAYAVNRRFKR